MKYSQDRSLRKFRQRQNVFLAIFTFLILISTGAYVRFKTEQDNKNRIRDAYSAACGVNPIRPEWLPDFFSVGRGSGVLLDTGYILTNAHVIDINDNGKLDDYEEVVDIHMSETANVFSGTVIYFSKYKWMSNRGFDFAVIRPHNPIKSSVRPMSTKNYSSIEIGDELFAIGRPMSVDPPHIYMGFKSSNVYRRYHRMNAPIYYGVSGGGVYDKRSGELIGLATRVKVDNRASALVPGWSEYVPISDIRSLLKDEGLDFVLEQKHGWLRSLGKTLASWGWIFYACAVAGLAVGFRKELLR